MFKGDFRLIAGLLVGLLLVLCTTPAAVVAQPAHQPAEAPIYTYRAAERQSLDLMLDYQALAEAEEPAGEEGNHTSPAPAGSFRAAQDMPRPFDWSRPVGKSWVLEPVALGRRQNGQPIEPDDDVSDSLIGIELRKNF